MSECQFINPDDADGPVNVVPESWDDEKPHQLVNDWSDQCWCGPRIDGNYVRHRSVFDAITEDSDD